MFSVLGGLKLSYRAFHHLIKNQNSFSKLPNMNFTLEQIFWIVNAQIWCSSNSVVGSKFHLEKFSHSLPKFRVNGPLQNSEDFARDFKCIDGSEMVPERKCGLW